MFLNQGCEFHGSFIQLAVRSGGTVKHRVVEKFSLCIEHHGFATRAEAGIDRDRAATAERRGQHEFA